MDARRDCISQGAGGLAGAFDSLGWAPVRVAVNVATVLVCKAAGFSYWGVTMLPDGPASEFGTEQHHAFCFAHNSTPLLQLGISARHGQSRPLLCCRTGLLQNLPKMYFRFCQ